MSGYFKLVDAHDGAFRIKLISGDGALMAVSAMFPTKQEAVAGIELLREWLTKAPMPMCSVMPAVTGEGRGPLSGSTRQSSPKDKVR
jgi:uncharacterized protein YegP (UPF0339 family)